MAGRPKGPAAWLAALFLLSGCQAVSLPTPQVAPRAGGQVAEAVVGTTGPLNPLFEQEDNAQDIDSLIYQGLTTVAANEQAVGLLASGWQLSGDGLSYTFNLRRGVRWADGKPFNADDVMFTFGVLQSPDYQQSTTQYWKDITVEKLGDLQVRFTLKAPSASFPLALRQGILPKHLFGGLAVDAIPASSHSGAKALGTGPFVVGSISPDRHVVRLDRNPYARPQPYLDHVVFHSYPSLADAVDAVSRGEADTVGAPEMPQLGPLAHRPDLALLQPRTFIFTAVFFNLTPDLSVFFNPPAVRQAMAQAIDRRKIVRDVLEGHADPAPGPIPPADWAYAKQQAEKLPYDPAQASRLLAEAGWQMNVQTGLLSRAGHDFVVQLATTDAYPYRQVAESVASQLRQIGIEVQVQPQPAPVLVSKYLVGRQYQMALAAFDVGPDPDQYSLWHTGAPKDSLNFASQLVPRQALIDKDLEDGRSSQDRNTRRAAYTDFQDLMEDAAPAIFLFEPRYTYVVSRRVRGLHTNPAIQPVDRFEYVADWFVTTSGA